MKSLSSIILVASFSVIQGLYFCTPLVNETWAGFVQAIDDADRLAVLCPFRISGDGCPTIEEYPEGLVVGRGPHEILIIECEPDLRSPHDSNDETTTMNTQCIIDCPGRHFTVGASSAGLILTNMVFAGATNASIHVESNGRLEVVHGIFERNAAGYANAGAIDGETGSHIAVQFTAFRNNQGIVGGAISVAGSSTLSVKNSHFVANRAMEFGGAISIGTGSVGEIDDSSFTWNEASSGGALFVSDLGTVEVSRANFSNNVALGFGGAIHVGGSANVDESTFQDNTGVEGGGAVNIDVGADLALVRNVFTNNLSTGYGPAVYDRYNSGVVDEGNAACGNHVFMDNDLLSSNGNLQCNGLYSVAGQNQLRQCLPFLGVDCPNSTDYPSSPPILPSSSETVDLASTEPTQSDTPTGA